MPKILDNLRAKHPGAYDDLDDKTLGEKLVAKYPEYKSDLEDSPIESGASHTGATSFKAKQRLAGIKEDQARADKADTVGGRIKTAGEGPEAGMAGPPDVDILSGIGTLSKAQGAVAGGVAKAVGAGPEAQEAAESLGTDLAVVPTAGGVAKIASRFARTAKPAVSKVTAAQLAARDLKPAYSQEVATGTLAREAVKVERVKQGLSTDLPPGYKAEDVVEAAPQSQSMYTGGSLESIGLDEDRVRRGLKKHLGTERERFESMLGNERGSQAHDMIRVHDIRRGANEEKVAVEVSRKLTEPEFFDKVAKIPYVGERGAARVSRFARSLPGGLGKKFGVAKEEQARLFDAAESIKSLDDAGNPIFGTHKKDGSWRFTEEQGKENWDTLSPRAQEAAKWWVAERDYQKTANAVVGDVEGYMHHYFKSKPIDRARKIVFSKKTAGARKVRTEAEGYVKDFEKSVEKSIIDFKNEAEYNSFIEGFLKQVSDEVVGDSVKEGFRRIERTKPMRGGKIAGQLGGNRQIPENLYDDFVRYTEGVKETGTLGRTIAGVGRYFKTNLLALNPGSAATNMISGGLQYALKVSDDFWRGALSGNFKPVVKDVEWLFKALKPSSIDNLPGYMFGSRGNIKTEFGPDRTTMDKANSFVMTHYGAIENYWKRVISGAELEAKGVAINKASLLENQKALADLSKAADDYGFDYSNVPRGLRTFRENPGGAMIAPYPTYGYKLVRMYGRYMAALNPAVSMPAKERAVRILTMGTMAGGVLALRSQDTKSGRIKVGEGVSMRGSKYPIVNAADAVRDPVTFVNELFSEGPLVDAVKMAKGWSDKYERSQPAPARWGELAKSFIPGFRISESIRQISEADRGETARRPQTFEQAIAPGVPLPEAVTGIEGGGKSRKFRRNPTHERARFYAGVNLKPENK